MKADRIVKRQNLKQKFANLQEVMKASRPLIEADKQLRRAFMAGYKQRLTEEIQETKAREAGEAQAQAQKNPTADNIDAIVEGLNAVPTDEGKQILDIIHTKHPELQTLSTEQPSEPRNQTEDSRSTESQEQTPVR